jgi:hypothetical protein
MSNLINYVCVASGNITCIRHPFYPGYNTFIKLWTLWHNTWTKIHSFINIYNVWTKIFSKRWVFICWFWLAIIRGAKHVSYHSLVFKFENNTNQKQYTHVSKPSTRNNTCMCLSQQPETTHVCVWVINQKQHMHLVFARQNIAVMCLRYRSKQYMSLSQVWVPSSYYVTILAVCLSYRLKTWTMRSSLVYLVWEYMG